jgi:hypothetical protein
MGRGARPRLACTRSLPLCHGNTVTAEPAAPAASPRSRLPIVLIVLGLLVVGYGLVFQGAPGAAAIWNGVLDSALVTPTRGAGSLGQPVGTRAVTLYLQRIAANRVMRMPPEYAGLADSLRPGDTLRLILGWGRSPDTALALGIIRNAAVLMDTALVLRAARQRSTRLAIVGGLLALVGVMVMSRQRRSAPAA